ncbi:MAG: hypothetical protein R3344_13630, partial [Acidobacteriota bacterium]|nr:hypothetical protein [Acidobacteriota bacterium]
GRGGEADPARASRGEVTGDRALPQKSNRMLGTPKVVRLLRCWLLVFSDQQRNNLTTNNLLVR